MAFPYRPSVHDDLRDLFGYRRVESTNRRLGSSSITRGEGSLDLWETETGPVVARYGDLPDGSFGVGIAHRGSFVNISGLIGDAEDRLDGHDTTLGQHGSRLDGHDSTLASHNTRISNAQSRADDAHGDAATAQSRADSAWTRAGTGIADAAAAHSRADAAWSRADSARSRADEAFAVASAAATSSKVASLEAEIDALQTQVGIMDSWLRAHTGYPNGGLDPNS